MAEHKAFIDFRRGGDTGEDTELSIQPVSDGEGASEVVFRRPTENLRIRTEQLRNQIQDLIYHRDFGNCIVEIAGGSLVWGGAQDLGGTGIITCTGTLKISPILAPRSAVKGSLSIGTAGANQITYAVTNQGFASHGLSAVTVEHRSISGQALQVSISSPPIRHIVVLFDAGNVAHTAAAVKSAVDTALVNDPWLAGKIAVTTNAASSGPISAQAETFLSPTADDESHWIDGSLLTNLTTQRRLRGGDGVALWYRYVIESTTDPTDPKGQVAGGRSESSISRGTQTIPAGSLFITSDSPAKITGAFPICRVGYQGQLIFADGTRVDSGQTYSFTSIPAEINAVAAPLVNSRISYEITNTINPQRDTAIANAINNYSVSAVQQRDAAITTALTNYNTNTIIPQRTTAINSALSSYNTSTIGPERTNAINLALAAYNTGTIGPERTSAINSALAAYNTSTIIPQRDTAIANAMAGASSGVTQTQVNNTISSYNTGTIQPERTTAINNALAAFNTNTVQPERTTALTNYNVNTIRPERDTAIQQAIAALPPASTPTAKSVTAVFTTSSGGDHNSSNINPLFDTTYANGGTFFVRRGSYLITTAGTALVRRVYAEAGGVTTLTADASLAAGTFIDLSGEWVGITFASSGTAKFRAQGAIFRNCSFSGNCLTLMNNSDAHFETCSWLGNTSAANAPDALTIDVAGGDFTFYKCSFTFAISAPTAEGGMVHITNSGANLNFDSCEFVGGASTAGLIYALYVQDSAGTLMTFNSCNFSAASTVNTGRTVKITNSSGLFFNQCTFASQAARILEHTSSNVMYTQCRFAATGSSSTVGTTILTASSAGVPSATIRNGFGTVFRDCVILIGNGPKNNGSKEPLVAFGGDGSAAVASPSAILVDGLHVQYTGANGNAAPFTNLVFWGNLNNIARPHTYKNITFDVNSNAFAVNGGFNTGYAPPNTEGSFMAFNGPAPLSSSYTPMRSIVAENITLLNAGQPTVSTGHAYFVANFAHVRDVTLVPVARTGAVQPSASPIRFYGSEVENLNILNAQLLNPTSGFCMIELDGYVTPCKLKGGFMSALPLTTLGSVVLLRTLCELSEFKISSTDNVSYPLVRVVGNRSRIVNCQLAYGPTVASGAFQPVGITVIASDGNASNLQILGCYLRVRASGAPIIQAEGSRPYISGNTFENEDDAVNGDSHGYVTGSGVYGMTYPFQDINQFYSHSHPM